MLYLNLLFIEFLVFKLVIIPYQMKIIVIIMYFSSISYFLNVVVSAIMFRITEY